MYFWQNPQDPIPNDDYTIWLDGWPGLQPDEWFLFSTWVAIQTVGGEVGFAEAPLQVGTSNLVPLFDPTTGEVHFTGMTGARVIAVATIYKLPSGSASPGSRLLPGTGMVLRPR